MKNDGLKKHDTPQARQMSAMQTAAHNEIVLFLRYIQSITRMDHVEFFALLGYTIGSTAGLNDHELEKELKANRIEKKDFEQVYLETFRINFDVAYNAARSDQEIKEPIIPKREV